MREVGPTGFLLKEEGETKTFKVQFCSCIYDLTPYHPTLWPCCNIRVTSTIGIIFRYSLAIHIVVHVQSLGKSMTCVSIFAGYF